MTAKLASAVSETIDQTHNKSHLHDEPVLSTEEDTDEADVAMRYEVKFKGDIPKSIVGFELDSFKGTSTIRLMVILGISHSLMSPIQTRFPGHFGEREPWEYVIEGLAKRRAAASEMTTRKLHDLAKSEAEHSGNKRQKTP